MSKWYLRDRGQVLGPFTREQLLEMRAQGTVASYHEVSTDKRLWQLIGDVPEFGAKATPRTAQPKAPPVEREETDFDDADYEPPAPRAGGIGGPKLIIGAVAALVVLGVFVLVIILVARPKGKETVASTPGPTAAPSPPSTPPPPVATGVITFAPSTTTRERDQVLDASVGLVVAGAVVKAPDGVRTEVLNFGTGSGFLISTTGHVVTNRHVIDDLVAFRDSVERKDFEREYKATVEPKVWVFFGRESKFVASETMYISPNYDLAILKIDRPTARYFALAKTTDADLPRFDPVFSLGFPGTDRRAQNVLNPSNKIEFARGAVIERNFRDADFQHTKERGAIRKSAFKARPNPKFRETYYVTHNAEIAGGNSGGPLVTDDGTVVGINTLGITQKVGGVVLNERGQNFAQTLAQLRTEIDRQVPGVVWREPSDTAKP